MEKKWINVGDARGINPGIWYKGKNFRDGLWNLTLWFFISPVTGKVMGQLNPPGQGENVPGEDANPLGYGKRPQKVLAHKTAEGYRAVPLGSVEKYKRGA